MSSAFDKMNTTNACDQSVYDKVVQQTSKCTACGVVLFAKTANPRIHPVLDVLICLVSSFIFSINQYIS